MQENESEFTIALLGEARVGKSALTIQFLQQHFISSYVPTIEDEYRTECQLKTGNVCVKIIDTAGQEEYSLSSRTSFLEMNYYYNLIESCDLLYLPLTIIGNKTDLKESRKIDYKEAKNLARKWNADYIETSAQTLPSVEKAFYELLYKIEKKSMLLDSKTGDNNLNKCSLM
ncbi:hypothetical protein BB561_002366 [Smittium simulii]|uniref:Uncharacterized protein n=1 Tax=Smittium simulii TaxID=133385 RepID=A0A2T9YQR3_9FUNG|nr:hypothetical protein BB561_002366 [Smittium simulii]